MLAANNQVAVVVVPMVKSSKLSLNCNGLCKLTVDLALTLLLVVVPSMLENKLVVTVMSSSINSCSAVAAVAAVNRADP